MGILNLFEKEIYDWDSWGNVFQSINDFRGLIQEIFIREKLKGGKQITNLTPGTNAVFKAGSYVIKIFAPKESGLNTDSDYKAEIESMRRAVSKGINTPNVIAASHIQDKYLFRYIIMDYIEGREAGSILGSYSSHEKLHFVRELKENLHKLNTKPVEQSGNNLLKEGAITNERWNKYSDKIREQIRDILEGYDIPQSVYVHGDITADNVIIDKQGKLYIIDFADSKIASAEYEYPPIIFDLFDFDNEMIHEFIKDMNYDIFIERLFKSILLHDFGAYFVKLIYEKYRAGGIDELSDIYEIYELIHSKLKYSG